MRAKTSIVYWGPGLSGKSTNLAVIREVLSGDGGDGGLRLLPARGEQRGSNHVALQLTDRFEEGLLVELVAPPGQTHCREMRRGSLEGVKGVVFVVDSSASAVAANLASLDELELLLGVGESELTGLPLVFQYNKRDLRDALSLSRLEELLNPGGRPSVEAVGVKGVGVFPSLKLILREIDERAAGVEGRLGPLLSPLDPTGRAAGAEATVSRWSELKHLEDKRAGFSLRSMKSALAAWKSPWLIGAGLLGGAVLREVFGLIGAFG